MSIPALDYNRKRRSSGSHGIVTNPGQGLSLEISTPKWTVSKVDTVCKVIDLDTDLTGSLLELRPFEELQRNKI